MGRNTLERSARKKGFHLPETMKTAVDLHLSGTSIRQAAKETNVPYPTLRRYVIKYKKDNSALMEPNYSVNKIFTQEEEKSLKEYILDCAYKFYGLSTKECRKLAFQMAEINKRKFPTRWKENGLAGRDWLRGFKKRHPDLTIKKPEACSVARATSFNPTNVQKFFDNLEEVYKRFPQFGDGTRVYNLDETSTTTLQRPGKVLAPKGKNVAKITSGERGILVTTCFIVNATGHALPPVMVFPRKKYVPHMIRGAPAGTLGLASKTGWMNSDLFVEVVKHFVKFTSSSKENPTLLLMDNHESHLSIEALDTAKNSGVTVLTLHPHTTNKLQPLDVGLNGPFKCFYNASIDSWLLRNPGIPMTIYDVAGCVGEAYLKAMTPINITNAFKKCGIFPFNRNIFSDLDYLPILVTDRPNPNVINDNSINDNKDKSRTPSPSLLSYYFEQEKEEKDESVVISEPVQSPSSTIIKDVQEYQNTPLSKDLLETTAQPNKCNFISPKDFRPKLKAGPRNNKKRVRKFGRSLIATDTPEKNALAENKTNTCNKTDFEKIKKVKNKLFKEKESKKNLSVLLNEVSNKNQEQIPQNKSEEKNIVLKDNFSPLKCKPNLNDFVLILFKTKHEKVYYIAKILEILDDEEECDFYVAYLKLKSKIHQTFIDPIEPDTAGVNIEDIKYIMPSPKIESANIRRKATYTFPVDISFLNMRY